MEREWRLAQAISEQEICLKALVIRNLLNVSELKVFDVLRFLEYTLPKWMPGFNLCCIPQEDMPFKEGETFPLKNEIWIREDVYVAACSEEWTSEKRRAYFTLAHELGHLMLHTQDKISFCRADSCYQIPAYQNPEWQANTFAAELLAPTSSILKNDLSVEEIQEIFKVSKSCAQRCLLRACRRLEKENVKT